MLLCSVQSPLHQHTTYLTGKCPGLTQKADNTAARDTKTKGKAWSQGVVIWLRGGSASV